MANSGQSFRRILSSRIFLRRNRINHGSGLQAYSPQPSEKVATIITSSKASISRLQQELEYSVAALDRIYQGVSSQSHPRNQQNNEVTSSSSSIIFHSAASSSFNSHKRADLDLSEISITPVSREPEAESTQWEEILITPL